MKNFTINLEDFRDNIFYEMERLSEGTNGHECIRNGVNKRDAATKLAADLIGLIEKQMY